MQAVTISNVFEVPVKRVVEQLGTAQDIFARCTPASAAGGDKPTGWEVLTTVELLLQVLYSDYYSADRRSLCMHCAGYSHTLHCTLPRSTAYPNSAPSGILLLVI